MKLNKIAKLCKEYTYVLIFEQEDDPTQWISDGHSMYPFYGMPAMDKESIFKIFDIPEKKADDFYFDTRAVPDHINLKDYDSTENQLTDFGMSIVQMGITYRLYISSRGIIKINANHLSPFSDIIELLSLHERKSETGMMYTVAKTGLLLQGVIGHENVNKDFNDKSRMLADLSAVALECLETSGQVSTNNDAEQTSLPGEA